METNSESGKATSEMIVVRTFIRKRKRTMITKKLPSNKLSFTLLIELSMKRLWRKISVETCTSFGKFFCKSAMTASSFSVSSIVLVFGCLVTVTRTAGFVRSEARPNFGCLPPTFTVAISSRRIGVLSGVMATTPLASSSAFVVVKTPRIIYSLEYSYKTPPLAFWFIWRQTSKT